MQSKRGDLVLVFDPIRPPGTGSGTRGLHVIGSVDEAEVIAHPVDRLDQHVRLPLAAIHVVFSATYVAEELFK